MKTAKMSLILGLAVALGLATEVANADFTFGKAVKVDSTIPYITEGLHNLIVDCLSYDGLEMYIESDRSGGQGGVDLWVLKRVSIDDGWGPPQNLGPGVNTPQDQYEASISADGLTLCFTSGTYSGSDEGDNDIYMTTRATKDDPWSQAVNLGPIVNRSGIKDSDSWVSPDGLELYFKSWRSGGYGLADMWVAKRTTENDPWEDPVNVGGVVNSPHGEGYLSLSPDGLLLLFSDSVAAGHQRPGGYGGADIWMARRASLSEPWQSPVNLGPKINAPSNEFQPRMSPDGRTLYFFSFSEVPVFIYGQWEAPIIPSVDFNRDGNVNMKDFSRLAQYWRQNEPSVDMGPMPWGDGRVDIQDVVVLGEYWLTYPGPVAHWKLDETEGWPAHDSAGSNDGFVMSMNPLWRPANGKVNGALELDGVDDYVSAPFVLDPSAIAGFSVFAWVKGGAARQVIISQQNGVNWLGTDASNGWLMTELQAPKGAPLFSQKVITDGNWHCVGFVWDGSNKILYVDNVEVARDTQPSLAGSQGGLYFGAGKNLEPGSFWSGLIDDVRIYDRAVTP